MRLDDPNLTMADLYACMQPPQFWFEGIEEDRASKASRFKFYVYALLDTRKPGVFEYDLGIEVVKLNFEPFYIGKGNGRRGQSHFKNSELERDKHTIKVKIINKIVKETKDYPKVIKIKENLSEGYAFDLEVKLIEKIGRRQSKIKSGPLANLADGGGGPSGIPAHNKGIPMTIEQSLKLSESHLGIRHTKESKDKLKKALSKNLYKLISPTNEEFIVSNLTDFCRTHALDIGNISRLVNKKQNWYKNWQGEVLKKVTKSRSSEIYKLTDQAGIVYITNNLRRFSREFKLQGLHCLLYNNHFSCRGWKCEGIEKIDGMEYTHYYGKSSSNFKYTAIDKKGNIYKDIYSLREFIQQQKIKLRVGSLYRSVNDDVWVSGWKISKQEPIAKF